MTARRHPEATARHALRLLGPLVVLAGLFGMHGLDSHGAAGTDTIAHAVTDAPVDAVAAGGAKVQALAQHAVAVGTQAGSTVLSISEATAHDAMDMGTAGMCMAILTIALLTLIQFLRASQVRSVLWILARSARTQWFLGRDPDPPSLIALSVHRC